MTALRVNESSGSLGSLQIADGFGGFLSGSLIAGSNVTISNNGNGDFTLSSLGLGNIQDDEKLIRHQFATSDYSGSFLAIDESSGLISKRSYSSPIFTKGPEDSDLIYINRFPLLRKSGQESVYKNQTSFWQHSNFTLANGDAKKIGFTYDRALYDYNADSFDFIFDAIAPNSVGIDSNNRTTGSFLADVAPDINYSLKEMYEVYKTTIDTEIGVNSHDFTLPLTGSDHVITFDMGGSVEHKVPAFISGEPIDATRKVLEDLDALTFKNYVTGSASGERSGTLPGKFSSRYPLLHAYYIDTDQKQYIKAGTKVSVSRYESLKTRFEPYVFSDSILQKTIRFTSNTDFTPNLLNATSIFSNLNALVESLDAAISTYNTDNSTSIANSLAGYSSGNWDNTQFAKIKNNTNDYAKLRYFLTTKIVDLYYTLQNEYTTIKSANTSPDFGATQVEYNALTFNQGKADQTETIDRILGDIFSAKIGYNIRGQLRITENDLRDFEEYRYYKSVFTEGLRDRSGRDYIQTSNKGKIESESDKLSEGESEGGNVEQVQQLRQFLLTTSKAALTVSGSAAFFGPVSITQLYGQSPIDVNTSLVFGEKLAVTDTTGSVLLDDAGNPQVSYSNLLKIGSKGIEGDTQITGSLDITGFGTSDGMTINMGSLKMFSDEEDIDLPKFSMINQSTGAFDRPEMLFSNTLGFGSSEGISSFTDGNVTSYQMGKVAFAGPISGSAGDDKENIVITSQINETQPEDSTNYLDFSFYVNSKRNITGSDSTVHADNVKRSVMRVGQFGDNTVENAFNVSTGIGLRGNVIPLGVINESNGGVNLVSTDNTLGNEKFRWGGLYLGEERYVDWGNSTVSKAKLGYDNDRLEVSGSAAFLHGLSGSLTQLVDGKSYLVAGTNVTISSASNGQVTINSTGGAGSSTIGSAEDGDYTDGLFKDFQTNTPVGTAIDRFNEILALLAPSPAPDLDDIDNDNSGASEVELSFGSSNNLQSESTPYFSVGTAAGLSALDVNGTYSPGTSGNNIRIGAFGSLRSIVGTLNEDITQDPSDSGNNHTANSFGNADQGELRLEINGSVIHTVDLTSFSSGDTNSSGSCFTSLSSPTAGTLDNGTSFPNFKHRTGGYKIVTGDQRQGWNYARILHVHGSTTTTNYIEWLNDTNSDALATAENELQFTGTGTLHLSGIEYFTGGSAEYRVRVTNTYKNVYDTNNITFTTSNAGSVNTNVSFSIANQSKPVIDVDSGEDHTKVLHITGSSTVSAVEMLSGSITAGVSVTHPFKSNISNGGQASDEGILIYSRGNSSTNQLETFRRENYRIISGAYNTQNDLIDSNNVWDGTKHMTASNAGHTNGLQFFNQKLYSPLNTINSGDFSTFSNGPSENPDYSGLSGQRTFYRWFKNETGSTHYDFSVSINGGSSTIVNAATSLDSGKIRVFVKFPDNGTRSTGWLDLASEFVLDAISDNDGAYVASFDSSLSASNIVSLGTVGILNNQYIGIRVEADASWAGYINQIAISFGAGTGTITAVPDLDNIDCNDTGVVTLLSFGSTKSITGYADSGTVAGFSAVGLNERYKTETSSNNLRRGVFDKTTIIEGDLNEDVDANSPDYVANAFSDANSGSLVLEVNGSDLHTVELTGSFNLVGTGEPGSGTGTSFTNYSGFFNLSVWRPAEYDNNVPYYLENYRTGRYRVHTNDQRDGWNYARVRHVGSWGTRTTNYVEWVNDSESQNNNISDAGTGITQFGDDDIFYMSGVKYFVNPTGSIETRISNLYKNVYSNVTNAISLTSLSNANAVSIVHRGLGLTSDYTENDGFSPLQTLNTNADSQNEVIHVTGSIQFSQSTSLSGAFTSITGTPLRDCGGKLTFVHPIKSNHSISTQTATSFLVFSSSDNSNANTNEYFSREDYRIVGGDYNAQSDITSSGNRWDSTVSINDNSSYPNFAKGLMIFDGLLISPKKGGNSGDFRNHVESGVFEGPNNNVNYSSLTHSTREYYRGFLNNTSNDRPSVQITLNGDATLVGKTGDNAASLGANKNIFVEVKIPGGPKTGWLDLGKPSEGAGNTNDGDGSLSGDLNASITTSGTTNTCTFNGVTVDGTTSGAEYFVIKISASENWTGYLTSISVSWS